MAIKQIAIFGDGIASNLTTYKTIEDALYDPIITITKPDFFSRVRKYGINICDIIKNNNAGDYVNLFTVGSNHKITLYINSKSRQTKLDWTYTACNVTVILFNNSGSQRFGQYSFNVFIDGFSTIQGERNGFCYLSAIVKEEEQRLSLKFVVTEAGNITTDLISVLWGDRGINPTELYSYAENSYEYPDTDPWSNAGYSGIGGGNGDFNFDSDIISLPSLPTVDATSSGFLQLFSGTLSKVRELSVYMWTDNFLENLVKITDNPLEIIMGLYMYPFTVPTSTSKQIRAGNVITPVTMGVPSSQIFEFDCGNFPVPNFYGAYLDYEPFTKCEIFLPYCGTFPLSMDDITGKTVNVKYRIDLLTGVCCAYVIVDGTVKYNFTGACAINIPISSRSFENLYNSIMGIVGNAFSNGSFGLPSIGSIAGAVTSGKNQIQHGGNVSGNSGYLGVQNPYLIFSVPNVAIPKGLNKYTGYPIFSTYALEDLEGYTEIEKIHLENMGNATQEEINSIINLLDKGVIF